jgi:hypothetical protein
MNGNVGFRGRLKVDADKSVFTGHVPRPRGALAVRVPGGRIMWTRDRGEALMFSRERFGTMLHAVHRWPDGTIDKAVELGSGTVTNVGVTSLANDAFWASPSGAAVNTLKLANNHATGTGTTASAATDIALQTAAAPTATTASAGMPTLVSAANSQIYQTVATLSYTSTLAITEWGLFSATALSASTGTPFTSTSGAGGVVTGTPLTASSTTVQGQQGLIIVSGLVYGLVLTNTTSGVVIPAWYKVADGTAGSTPSGTAAFTFQPVMLDHLVFAAINVVNGSTITFTFQLTCSSGG